jgi:hypothetical protein
MSFSLSGLPAGQNDKGQRLFASALPYSHLPGRSGCTPAEPYPPDKQDHSIAPRKELTPSVTLSFELTRDRADEQAFRCPSIYRIYHLNKFIRVYLWF